MKKSYIVFAVFTTFTQAVFAVLLFLEKFGILHFDGQLAGIAMCVVPAVGAALTKSCDEKYEEIQRLFYVLFGFTIMERRKAVPLMDFGKYVKQSFCLS